MAKKRSIIKYIITAILVAIGIVLCFGPIPVAGTDYIYNGFANSISLGLDLSGGLSIVYDCEPTRENTNLGSAIDATVTRLSQILYSEGYSEATVKRQGTSRIRIEVPSAKESDSIFTFLENPRTLSMTREKASGDLLPKIWITGDDVTDVYASYNSQDSTWGVSMKFTNEGAQKFADLTKEASSASDKNIYIYLGEVKGEPWNTLTCENEIKDGATFISGGSINSQASAEEYAFSIMSGTFNVKLKLIENSVISATLGREALTYGLIAGAVALAIILIIMGIRYGVFGVLADLALVIYMILMLFFLQAIPFVQLTLPGIAGIILSLGMAVDGNIIIFERIREEYASGKKIPFAVKSGFKKAFWPIFDSNITTIVTSIILYILGTTAIKGFAITLLLGIVLSMFTTLVITRFLVKWYLPLNATNPKPVRLYRKEGVAEVIEEPAKEEKGEEIVIDPAVSGKQTPDFITGGNTNE